MTRNSSASDGRRPSADGCRPSPDGRRLHGAVPGFALVGALVLAALIIYGLFAGRGNGERPAGSGLDEAQDHIRALLEGTSEEDVRPSSPGSFIDDLAQASGRDASEGSSAVGWEADDTLPSVAGDVLKRYEVLPRAELITAGYLDLKGRVWGALVRSSEGWVDIVSVCAAAGDGEENGVIVGGGGGGDGGVDDDSGGGENSGVSGDGANGESAVVRIVRLR